MDFNAGFFCITFKTRKVLQNLISIASFHNDINVVTTEEPLLQMNTYQIH